MQNMELNYKLRCRRGEIRIYNSLSAAERDLKLNIKYGLKICAKKLDFKGYILVKLNEPLIDCRKK